MTTKSHRKIQELIRQLIAHRFVIYDSNISALIWLREGMRIRLSFERFLISEFINANYDQVELPFLIEPQRFALQNEHADGLAPYLFHVQTASSSQNFILRPTSEVPFTDIFEFLINNDVAPPYRFIQNVTVFRDEVPENAVPFLRQRQITPFIETYTMSLTESENTKVFESEINIYQGILRKLQIPFYTNLRSREDTFPEAQATIAFDTTNDGNLEWQLASVHNLGQSFALATGLKMGDDTPYQTSTGISGRAMLVSLYYSWLNNNRDFSLWTDEYNLPWNKNE